MVKIVILENGTGSREVERLVQMLPAPSRQNLTVITTSSDYPQQQNSLTILDASRAINPILNKLIKESGSTRIAFIDARSPLTEQALTQFIARCTEQRSSAMSYIAVMAGSEMISMPDLNTDNLVSQLTSDTVWPLLCVMIDTANLGLEQEIAGDNVAEMILSMILRTAAAGESAAQATGFVEMDNQEALQELCGISMTGKARCLEDLINAANIEELFPQHPWSTHREESAAAVYHTLAAHFIRLGANDTALECLALGDQFEDSPRSLALKGLIALNKGETLTAVANMVSSLQLYENRKRDTQEHYLSFKPLNLEVINSSLNAGLSALNKRDNARALGYFANAVFNFDSFYNETGVNGIKALSH